METQDQVQVGWEESSQRLDLRGKLLKQESLLESESFRESLRRDFFGSKMDKQKSIFVFSMLFLIAGFFVLSAFNLSLDVIVGIATVCYGLYGGIRWTRQFLNELH